MVDYGLIFVSFRCFLATIVRTPSSVKPPTTYETITKLHIDKQKHPKTYTCNCLTFSDLHLKFGQSKYFTYLCTIKTEQINSNLITNNKLITCYSFTEKKALHLRDKCNIQSRASTPEMVTPLY